MWLERDIMQVDRLVRLMGLLKQSMGVWFLRFLFLIKLLSSRIELLAFRTEGRVMSFNLETSVEHGFSPPNG